MRRWSRGGSNCGRSVASSRDTDGDADPTICSRLPNRSGALRSRRVAGFAWYGIVFRESCSGTHYAVNVATQEQFVSLIDDEIVEIARCVPARPDALDALLDLRLRVLETAAFEWIEREVSDHARRRGIRSHR